MPAFNSIGPGSIVAFVLVFGLLVFVHELGHLLLAKRAGILCREFALGMGPKLFSRKRGETEYTLRLLPIGGLVRMAGEDPELDILKPHMEVGLEVNKDNQVTRIFVDQSKPRLSESTTGTLVRFDLERQLTIALDVAGDVRTYDVHPKAHLVTNGQEIQIAPLDRQFKGKTVSERFWAIFAGPAANFLLAFVLLATAGALYGVPTNVPEIGKVVPGGPADQAGLQEGDKVLSIESKPVATWEELAMLINKSPGQTLTLAIERDGVRRDVPVTVANENNVGKIQMTKPVTYSPLSSLQYGAEATYSFTVMILGGLGKLFTGEVGVKDLSGPAGIFQMTTHFAQEGLEVLIRWTAVLSINLGIFNLLPIPALDGGRLTFLGIEALRGKPIDSQKEGMVHFIGFAFLMLLILVVTWNDVLRLLN